VIDLGKLAKWRSSTTDVTSCGLAGRHLGQVAAALAPHGLAISSGDTKSVGVGGLTLTGASAGRSGSTGWPWTTWLPQTW